MVYQQITVYSKSVNVNLFQSLAIKLPHTQGV